VTEQTKILVVEDDYNLAEMLSTYFRAEGYSVSAVSWGEDAVEAVEQTSPDLITLDIHLPDIDGYEVCRRIRKIRRAEHVPVIFLTERRKRKDRLVGLELGAVDYITKPFDVQELSLRVGNALHRSKLRPIGNPVTGLPEGRIVQEKLEKMMAQPPWALVITGFEGLDSFRDNYGIVAADDVVRAARLIIGKALDVSQSDDEFLGHVDTAYFIIITTPDRAGSIAENCLLRLETSIPYFYSAFDDKHKDSSLVTERLHVRSTVLSSTECQVTNLPDLREALIQATEIHAVS
jgi:DNA-binding response OmpR family regulator